MSINPENWGAVQVSSNPKKKTATFKVDLQGNLIPIGSFADETAQEKNDRIKKERAKKLGLQ